MKKVEDTKTILIIIFLIIMALLSLYIFLDINSKLESAQDGYMSWFGFWISMSVFSVPFLGFIAITCLFVFTKTKIITTVILTVVWIIVCLPCTWIIAMIVDQYVYLGVELYL